VGRDWGSGLQNRPNRETRQLICEMATGMLC
jgi:hypothetical protein